MAEIILQYIFLNKKFHFCSGYCFGGPVINRMSSGDVSNFGVKIEVLPWTAIRLKVKAGRLRSVNNFQRDEYKNNLESKFFSRKKSLFSVISNRNKISAYTLFPVTDTELAFFSHILRSLH